MSGLTNYLALNGYDLSFIFQSGNSSIITGFKLVNGNDIGSIFQAYTAGNQSAITGLISVGGGDICTLFNRIVFSPLSITGCCLWMDAADATTITINTSKVSDWNDKSGLGYHFTQTNAAYRPTYGSNAITFTYSSTNYLLGNPTATGFAIGTNSYACFVVCSITNNGRLNTTSSIYTKAAYATASGRMFITRNNGASGNLNARFSHDTSVIYGISDGAYTADTYRIIELIVNRREGKDTIYTSGTLIGTTTYSSDTATNFSNSYVMLIGAIASANGTGTYAGQFLDGKVAEIVSYSNAYDMSSGTREKIEGYLANKWSISLPINHPYYNNPP